MSLKDDLEALASTKPRNFDQWLTVADPEERELVLNAIYSNTLPNRLCVTLTKNGIPITRETIIRMRDESR